MGVLLLLVGVGVLVFGLMNHLKGKRILAAPFKKTGELSRNPVSEDPKGAMSTEGKVVPPAQALLSPCTKQACLYYEVKVERLWEKSETTQDGTKTVKGSTTLDTVKGGTTFGLDDGSGVLSIDVSKGADFDNMKDGYKKELNGRSWASNIQFGEMHYDVPAIGSSDGWTIGFKATERYVPVEGNLFVLGKLEGSKIIKPGWRSMVASNKGRDGLLGSIQKKKKFSFIGGGVAAVLSIPLMIFGPKTESNSCNHIVAGALAKCDDNVRAKDGNSYTWTVEKAGNYELQVTPPSGKKFPLDAQLVVKNAKGDTVADESGEAAGKPATAKLENLEPGTYQVTVRDTGGMEVKGGFDYAFEIRAPGLAKTGDAVAAKGDAPAAAPAAVAGALEWKTLDKLNAKIEVPADATIEDTTGDFKPTPPPSYSVFNESAFNVSVSGLSDLDPDSLPAMKKLLALDPNKIKKFTKEEKTKDGWILEWEADSMMEPGKTLYGVNVKKTIAGKGVSCARNVDDHNTAVAISKSCQTLSPKSVAMAPAAAKKGKK